MRCFVGNTHIRFTEPTTVCVEASLDTILSLDLDEVEGEHFDYIYDVLSIEVNLDEYRLETCRTIERPGREIVVLPRSAVAGITYPCER